MLSTQMMNPAGPYRLQTDQNQFMTMQPNQDLQIAQTIPFESPVVTHILTRFVFIKCNDPKLTFDEKVNVEKLGNILLSSINTPNILLVYPPEPNSADPEERTYAINYNRWIEHCCKGTYRLSDIFGKTMLLYLLKLIKQSLAARFSQLSPEIQDLIPAFFGDLDRELSEPTSSICSLEVNSTETPVGPEPGKLDFSARDAVPRQEELEGVLEFKLIGNNGSRESWTKLVNLKSIFSKQLPKMPREYITRLVLDRKHLSIMIIKRSVVVGGICFRPFREQDFAEIAFCAITSSEQVKGYGTYLMNHLKESVKGLRITHILTYADNFAIGYFKKQGFTKEVTLQRNKWAGFVKDYEGGTLMECVINPQLNYLEVPSMVRSQRSVVYELLNKISNSHVVHPGMAHWKNGHKKIVLSDIIGLEDTWKSKTDVDNPEFQENLQTKLNQWIEEIRGRQTAWPFLHPVDPSQVSDYYDVIKNPIDLETIGKKLETRQFYITEEIFLADCKRMCANCRIYNQEGTTYYECANELEKFIDSLRYRNLDTGERNLESAENKELPIEKIKVEDM